MPYRADIDGLRAIAVLAVVLYHLDIGPFRSGFIGVDIFFVISGYLITGIVQREIEQGKFTFAGFYERRVRRLFPALFVMLLFTLLLGLSVLLPSDLSMLGKSITATLLFGSNILFWRNSGYFDSSAELNPLLHTWSLAVEEQFYIGFPVLLLLVHRYARNHLRTVLLLGAAGSLAASLAVQPLRPGAVFFLSPFRGWELLAGALLTVGAVPMLGRRWLREALSAVALLLLLASLYWIEPGVAFPGWQALVPVLATASLLHVGGSGGSLVHSMLRFRPLVFFGLISYSLYLWHWPLLVFAKYLNVLEPLGPWRWGVLSLSVASATISYRWVEQPFRSKHGSIKSEGLFRRTALAFGSLALGAMLIVTLHGMPTRFTSAVLAFDRARTPHIPFRACVNQPVEVIRAGTSCIAGNAEAQPDMMVWGDSHALAWAPAFDKVLRKQGRSALLAMGSACPPLVGVRNLAEPGCRQKNDAVIAYLAGRADIETVVLIASWPSYSNAGPGSYQLFDDQGRKQNARVFPPSLQRTAATLQDIGKRVWIIGPTPGAPSDLLLRLAIAESRQRGLPQAIELADFSGRAAGFDSALPGALALGGVFYTDPRPWFCGAEGLCSYERSGDVLYRDDGHLSQQGADFVGPYLEREFFLVQAGASRSPGSESIIKTASQK